MYNIHYWSCYSGLCGHGHFLNYNIDINLSKGQSALYKDLGKYSSFESKIFGFLLRK